MFGCRDWKLSANCFQTPKTSKVTMCVEHSVISDVREESKASKPLADRHFSRLKIQDLGFPRSRGFFREVLQQGLPGPETGKTKTQNHHKQSKRALVYIRLGFRYGILVSILGSPIYGNRCFGLTEPHFFWNKQASQLKSSQHVSYSLNFFTRVL